MLGGLDARTFPASPPSTAGTSRSRTRPGAPLLGFLYAALALALSASSVDGQSLAEAARREKERRQALEKRGEASRTFTEEDLAETEAELATGDRSSSRDEAPGPADDARPRPGRQPRPAGSEATRREKTEAYWRELARTMRARLEQARREYETIDRMIRVGQAGRYDENGQRRIYSAQALKAMADQAQEQLDAAQKALDEFYRDARRAGALPGWLRE